MSLDKKLEKKLNELQQMLEELVKSVKVQTKDSQKQPKKGLPNSALQQEDHPKKLSEKEAMRMVKEEDDKKDKEEKREDGDELRDCEEIVKVLPNGQWEIMKARQADPQIKTDWTKRGHQSVFNMGHVNEIIGMKDHGAAKTHAHKIVDSSSAKDETKKKIKAAIDKTSSPKDLATMMSNHILSHSGLNVIGGKKIK